MATKAPTNALKEYQKALALSEQVTQKRGTLNDREWLSANHYWVAECMLQSGNVDGARKHYQAALDGMSKVIQERGSPDDQRDAAACRHRLADLQWDAVEPLPFVQNSADSQRSAGELDAPLETYLGVREIYQDVAKIRDTPMDWQYLCVSENNLAAVLEEKGDFQGALDAYRQDKSVAETLVERWNAPSDKESLAVSCWNIAQLEYAPLDERLSCAKRGLDLSRMLREGTQDSNYHALYQELMEDFQSLLAKLENHNGTKLT